MRHSIASVSLAGVLKEERQAAAQARLDGIEIFENDLRQFWGVARELRQLADDDFVDSRHGSGDLCERGAQVEIVHARAAPLPDRFEFEFVERRAGDELHGPTKPPFRFAALVEWRTAHACAGAEFSNQGQR